MIGLTPFLKNDQLEMPSYQLPVLYLFQLNLGPTTSFGQDEQDLQDDVLWQRLAACRLSFASIGVHSRFYDRRFEFSPFRFSRFLRVSIFGFRIYPPLRHPLNFNVQRWTLDVRPLQLSII